MAHFTSVEAAAATGQVGDTIDRFPFTWDRDGGAFEIVWVARSRRTILARAQGRNLWKFAEASGCVPLDAFIGPDWTTERVLKAVIGERELAAAAAKADEHERVW